VVAAFAASRFQCAEGRVQKAVAIMDKCVQGNTCLIAYIKFFLSTIVTAHKPAAAARRETPAASPYLRDLACRLWRARLE
jgi:hypothetical protein